jgi:hypothetical protein
MCSLLGSVDRARCKVDGLVLAISRRLENGRADRRGVNMVAIVFRFNCRDGEDERIRKWKLKFNARIFLSMTALTSTMELSDPPPSYSRSILG